MKLTRLLALLAILVVANVAWRIYANWGLITVHADGTPIASVLRSIEKQAGITLKTNLAEDITVSMHVEKVPLLHALEVLAAHTESSWNVSYFAAPDKQSITAALTSMTKDQSPEGWKRFSMFGGRGGGMRGFGDGDDKGATDPREDHWKAKAPADNTLHAYFEQAALMTSAQFWAPESWNPGVAKLPKEGELQDVVPKLAKSAGGICEEVFLLRARPQNREIAAGGEERTTGGGDRVRRTRSGPESNGPQSETIRQAMEERARAQIEKLPADKRAAALAELEERKRFWEEMSKLSPEERRARMQERMEEAMNNTDAAARMENGSAKRSAMQSAEQRAERYRDYLNRKRESAN